MSDLNGNLSGSGTLSGRLGGGGVPAQDVYWDDILNKPNFAAVATSGSYNDLTDKPTIPPAQVNADWNATSGVAEILNKPNLANVATSGSYNDLIDKPTIPAAQVNADWNATSGVAEILNKPTIPPAQVNADWNAASGVAEILNKPNLANVATSGSYNDLTDKPTIPAAQVNADWNATSGVAEILNKPTIPTTASQIDYDNTTSGLQADDVQDAITELKSNLTDLETQLYYNASGETGSIQLSDDPTNYDYIRIFYQYGGYGFSSVEVYNYSSMVNLQSTYMSSYQNVNYIQFGYRMLTISGTTISNHSYGFCNLFANKNIEVDRNTNLIKIYKIMGIKLVS